MEVPCVRVPRDQGESTRRALAEQNILREDYEIESTDDGIFLPVQDPGKVDETYDIVMRSPPRRRQPELPEDILGFSPTYERLGSIALIEEHDPEQARTIANALMESSLPITGVLNRRSNIQGEYRIREWEQLAGESTETIHREFGVELHVDVTRTYFSPRLATERHRVIEQVAETESVFDMFAGVGPFIIPMAVKGADTIGVDINEAAISYLQQNAELNGVTEQVTAVHGDVREVAADYDGWADRLIMNLPHTADEFLPTAKLLASDACRIHYYDIQPAEDPYAAGEAAIRAVFEDQYDVTVANTRTVRSYAPHEVNVCLDVDVTETG